MVGRSGSDAGAEVPIIGLAYSLLLDCYRPHRYFIDTYGLTSYDTDRRYGPSGKVQVSQASQKPVWL